MALWGCRMALWRCIGWPFGDVSDGPLEMYRMALWGCRMALIALVGSKGTQRMASAHACPRPLRAAPSLAHSGFTCNLEPTCACAG